MIPTYRNKDLNIKIINNSEKNKKLKPGKSIQNLNIWVELKMIFNSISFMSHITNHYNALMVFIKASNLIHSKMEIYK